MEGEGDVNLLDDQEITNQNKKVPLIYAWGKNQDGELGVPGTKNAVSPSVCRGFKGYARQIGTARSHTIILNQNGQIYLAGSLLFGKIGITAQINNFRQFRLHKQMSQYKVKKVACGDYHTLALIDDGSVFSWGGTLWEKTGHKTGGINKMEQLSKQAIIDIACGDFHSIALTKTGKIYSWGGGGQNKNKGQLGHSNKKDLSDPVEIKFFNKTKIIKIACGDYHTMVMTQSGDLYSFGEGTAGQLGTGGKDDCAIPKKVKINFQLALEEYFRSDITDETRIQQIALGGHHSLLLTNKGHVYACGFGSQGQLGFKQGQIDNKFEPVLVKVLLGKQIIMIAAGANHSLALSSKYNVYACGYNAKGQLGLGEEKTVTVWTHVTALEKKKVGQIYAGGDHSWAVIDQLSPFIQDYQPPSPIRLNIDEATIIRQNQNQSKPDKSGLSGTSMDDILISLTPNRKLQLILTEVQMSHRFVRFIRKDNCNNIKKRIDDYINFVYDNQRKNMKFHKITDDDELYDENGKIIFNANPKGLTIMLVCQVPQTANQYILSKPNKTTIGIGELMILDSSMLRVQGNKIPIHNMWFFKFHQMFDDIIERARFYQLRPKMI